MNTVNNWNIGNVVTTPEQLIKLRDDKKSVVVKRFQSIQRHPAAVLMCWQFSIVIALLASNCVFEYIPTDKKIYGGFYYKKKLNEKDTTR